MSATFSLAQIDVVLGEPDRNLERAAAAVQEAAQRGSELVILPELWSTGYDLENADLFATSVEEGIFARMADLAREYHIHILGSSLSRLAPGKVGNTIVLVNPEGTVLGTYTKIHLFRLMGEDRFLTAGDSPVVAETPWGRMGMAICYDLRFPELFRAYALAGCSMVVLPSEWPHPRLAHWQTLLRARAIENQLFILACNRVGSSVGSRFFGHSCIIDPWGEAIVEGGEDEVILTAEVPLERIEEARMRIPVLEDRRPEVYGRLEG